MKHGMPDNLNESPFRSTFFWSELHTLANNNLLLNSANPTNLEGQALEGASASKININHGENNSNMPLVNHSLAGLAGLSAQLGTAFNPPLNILESSYVISQANNFTDHYTNPQNNGNPSNGTQDDLGGLFHLANYDLSNEFLALLEEENQGDISSFFNDEGFEWLKNVMMNSNNQQGTLNSTDQTVENHPFVEQAVAMPTCDGHNQVSEDYFVGQAQDVFTMPALTNDQIVENAFVEPPTVTMPDLDNNYFTQQLPIQTPNTVLPAQNILGQVRYT